MDNKNKLSAEAQEALEMVTSTVDFNEVFYSASGAAIVDGITWMVHITKDGGITETDNIYWESGFSC